jgi:dTDP-4-dehydrorhamnose reductase
MIVVLGAGGLLGQHLLQELGDEARGFDRAGCDITDFQSVARACEGAGAIINCAAWTNVDGAETHPEEAYAANVTGVENVVRAARGAKVVHISTDFVFDGTKVAPYDEIDPPNPQSVYARTKFQGEQKLDGKYFLIRVQGLYGNGGKNFASKLRELILAKKPLKLDRERKVQPTWARAAARQIRRLAASEKYGTYHVSCKGAATWAEFAQHVAERLGAPRNWEEVSTASLSAPAARPVNCLFAHRRLRDEQIDVMPDWRSALDEYLEEEK